MKVRLDGWQRAEQIAADCRSKGLFAGLFRVAAVIPPRLVMLADKTGEVVTTITVPAEAMTGLIEIIGGDYPDSMRAAVLTSPCATPGAGEPLRVTFPAMVPDGA